MPYFKCKIFDVVFDILPRGGGGGAVLTLAWYMYMCLPFGALFREIWFSDRGAFIRDEGAQITWFGCILGKLLYKAPNLVKIGCFTFKNGILMGGKLGEKLVKRKSDFRGPAGTSTYNFGESNPPPRHSVRYQVWWRR